MNSTVAKVFTGKLYFVTELLLASSLYCMLTLILYYYCKDESFYNAFYYSGIFLTLQIIWQLFQARQDHGNEEGEHYPLKLSFFFFLSLLFGTIFFGLYFLFFHDVMSLHFKPIGSLNLVEISQVDSKPDDYIRVPSFFDDYYSLTFSMNLLDDKDGSATPVNTVGCGCGVVFGPLLGTIGSPVDSTGFERKKSQTMVLLPTMTCFCDDDFNCRDNFGSGQTPLYYRVHGDYSRAIQNTKCPPESFDFIHIFNDEHVPISNVQIILIFTLTYIPLMFMSINFTINYSKLGVIAFIKNHPNVRPKGISYMIFYFFLKWAGIAFFCIFIAEEIFKDRSIILLYAMIGLAGFPGAAFGLFFFYYNPNFKFKQEFKANIMEIKDYAEATHESVENFVDLCAVGLELKFKYLSKMLRELVVSLGFKGVAQSVFLFAFIAPEFLTEFLNEPRFQQLPTNIRDNLVINSMILTTGTFHGLFMGAALIVYQIVYDKVRLLGIVSAATCFVFFIASVEWFIRQLAYFKSFKKALASHLMWLYPAFEVTLNRSLVNLYYNRSGSRSEIQESS